MLITKDILKLIHLDSPFVWHALYWHNHRQYTFRHSRWLDTYLRNQDGSVVLPTLFWVLYAHQWVGAFFVQRSEKPLRLRAFRMASCPTFQDSKCKASSRYDICRASWELQTNVTSSSSCSNVNTGGRPVLLPGERRPVLIVFLTWFIVIPRRSAICRLDCPAWKRTIT